MATTDGRQTHGQAPGPVELAIVVCSAVFTACIFIAPYLGASIGTLFWSLPCVVASEFSIRRTKFGYVLGVASGAVGGLFTGGWSLGLVFDWHGMRVSATIMHVLTAVASMGLVFFSLVGYARLPKKSWGDAALFIAAIILVAAFLFVATFWLGTGGI
jgi:hypothetical protein